MAKKDVKVLELDAKINERQKAWIDYYIQTGGDGVEACKLAGYKGKRLKQIAWENKIKLAKFLEPRTKEIETDRVMSIQDVMEFWTNTIKDKYQDMKDRIKCSELLVKAKGGFIDKVVTTEIGNEAFKDLSTEELRKIANI